MKREYLEYISELSTLSIDTEAGIMYILHGTTSIPYDLASLEEQDIMEIMEYLAARVNMLHEAAAQARKQEIEVPKPPTNVQKDVGKAKEMIKKLLKK